jgi:hypothetical protein
MVLPSSGWAAHGAAAPLTEGCKNDCKPRERGEEGTQIEQRVVSAVLSRERGGGCLRLAQRDGPPLSAVAFEVARSEGIKKTTAAGTGTAPKARSCSWSVVSQSGGGQDRGHSNKTSVMS